MTSLNLNYLLKTLSPYTVIMGVRDSTNELEAGDMIQSIAPLHVTS